MSLRNKIAVPIALAAALAFVGVGLARGDVITLQNGHKLEGTIVKERPDSVEIQTKIGVQTVDRGDIVKIEKAPADPRQDFESRRAALTKDSRAGASEWVALGELARDHKLPAEAKAAYEKALTFDLDNEKAREALGYQRWQGKWLTAEQVLERKGKVEYKGRWVTPEEKDKLEQGYTLVGGEWLSKEALAQREADARAREEAARQAASKPPEAKPGPQGAVVVQPPKQPPPPVTPPDGSDPNDPTAGLPGGIDFPPGTGVKPLNPGGAPGQAPDPAWVLEQLAKQKADARMAEQKLGLVFEDVEEGPLLVHTTCPKNSQKFLDFLKNLGTIYKLETKTYNIPFETPLWPGKLQIYFFQNKDEFDRFATDVDDAAGAVQSGGYFIEGVEADGHAKHHITMFDLDLGTLSHELSHAFMSRYDYSQKRVIPWLNEGTAEFLRVYVTSQMGVGQRDYRHLGLVKEMLAHDDKRVDLRTMMAKQQIAGTEIWAYAVSYTLTDFMIQVDPSGKKFTKLLKSMKVWDGSMKDRWQAATPDAQRKAIEEAFGTSLEKFEAAWKEYVRNAK